MLGTAQKVWDNTKKRIQSASNTVANGVKMLTDRIKTSITGNSGK